LHEKEFAKTRTRGINSEVSATYYAQRNAQMIKQNKKQNTLKQGTTLSFRPTGTPTSQPCFSNVINTQSRWMIKGFSQRITNS